MVRHVYGLQTVRQKCAGCDGQHRSIAERSYPSPEVRGGSRRELPHVWGQGWWREELPHARGQCRRPGGPTTRLRSGAAAGRSNPKSKEWWMCKGRRAERSYSTFKVRRGSCEEIPLIQGKEQQLRFGGAAMKGYPTSKIKETQVRW